jgi:hypothetical protein
MKEISKMPGCNGMTDKRGAGYPPNLRNCGKIIETAKAGSRQICRKCVYQVDVRKPMRHVRTGEYILAGKRCTYFDPSGVHFVPCTTEEIHE